MLCDPDLKQAFTQRVSSVDHKATTHLSIARRSVPPDQWTGPMLMSLSNAAGPAKAPIVPHREMGAYEALWLEKGATFKTIADRFAQDPQALPSDFVEPSFAAECAAKVMERFRGAGINRFGVRLNHAGDYPEKLRDARHPVEMLYFQGIWELTETKCIAVVGSRQASAEGQKRAARIARELAGRGYTVVSGLAAGIDTAALTAAIEAGGQIIAVIGTPLTNAYPAQNKSLQAAIAERFLVVSQVPVLRYERQAPPQNRLFFPERNVTMSALTEATIIVEAGETSGTLTQARAALHQGRKLFILDSCFQRSDLTWPRRFEALGAVRVREPADIWRALGE
jgi:DNA processing protein